MSKSPRTPKPPRLIATSDVKDGVALIAAERARQINVKGWTPEHDDEHFDASLALAAVCYAAPKRLFMRDEYATSVSFEDPWPDSWDKRYDKRGSYGNGFEVGNGIADPATYTFEQRLDLLVKAGAMLAAEIDRLQRVRAKGLA
jgi:hypothetical protein